MFKAALAIRRRASRPADFQRCVVAFREISRWPELCLVALSLQCQAQLEMRGRIAGKRLNGGSELRDGAFQISNVEQPLPELVANSAAC